MAKPEQVLTNGANVVAKMMGDRCNRALTADQAEALWSQCEARLTAKGLAETVIECKELTSGSLDTLPREDLLSVISEELASCDWPCNGASAAENNLFLVNMCAAFKARAYVRAEEAVT